MAVVTKYPQGTLCWTETQSTKPAQEIAFYQAVFGWQSETIPLGDGTTYTLFRKQGDVVAGLRPAPKTTPDLDIQSHWYAHIAVDNVDAICAQVSALGGQVIGAPADFLDYGQLAWITDPSGCPVGLWEAKSHIGAQRINEDGALVWNELTTWKADQAIPFFEKLLGWAFTQLHQYESGYWLFRNRGRLNGGVLQMTADWKGMSPHWMTYFHVDDAEATVEKVKMHQGKIIHGPVDETTGKIAICASPTGVQFSILQSKQIDPWEA